MEFIYALGVVIVIVVLLIIFMRGRDDFDEDNLHGDI